MSRIIHPDTYPQSSMDINKQARVKTVVVMGGSYGGARAAALLAEGLPDGWRVILVDRNSHANHVYNLPRCGVLPGHEHKVFIPYTNIFAPQYSSSPSSNSKISPHVTLHARITSLTPHTLTLSRSFPELGFPSPEIQFDYAVYALGSHLPAPIDLWGPPPRVACAHSTDESVKDYGGTKSESISWLKRHQTAVKSAESVLVVGGGALGIQYATDIAAVHPSKQITLLHSRHRLLPRFDEAMHSEILQTMTEANITTILGERLDLASTREDPPKRNQLGQRVVRTVTGREVCADLILLCTGQKPNVELLETMDSGTIVPENGMARVSRSLQLVSTAVPTPTSNTAESHPHSSWEPLSPAPETPAGEPAYAYADDAGIDRAQLEHALEGLTLEDAHAPAGDSPTSSPSFSDSSSEFLSRGSGSSTPTMASTPMSPFSEVSEPMQGDGETSYPHIFVVGDAADAFGAINAGHTAYYQAEVAARNVLKLIRREEQPGFECTELELEHYEPTTPGIKVSLGLTKSVYQTQGVVGTKNDGAEDLDAGLMWAYYGMKNVDEEGMRA